MAFSCLEVDVEFISDSGSATCTVGVAVSSSHGEETIYWAKLPFAGTQER